MTLAGSTVAWKGSITQGKTHLLVEIDLPARYENLVDSLGPDIARILVSPSGDTLDLFRQAGIVTQTRRRGIFAPVVAPTGTGKTTLASNLQHWLPEAFGRSVVHQGAVGRSELLASVAEAYEHEAVDDRRAIPVVVEDREGSEPTDAELAQIKGFLRSGDYGSRCLLLWPEVDPALAERISRRYRQTAGNPGVPIPFEVAGPPRDLWREVAQLTLQLVNDVESLDSIVDLDAYEPNSVPTIGDYLDQISADLSDRKHQLLSSTQRPIALTIVFASESTVSGVLEAFTGSRRLGLVEPQRVFQATRDSRIGRWWAPRLGQLASAVYRLDLRVIGLSPATSIPLVRYHGPDDARRAIAAVWKKTYSKAEIERTIERSDLGKYITGLDESITEGRGHPATSSTDAYACLVKKYGLTGGHDKRLNAAIGSALRQWNDDQGVGFASAAIESKLQGYEIIPDVTMSAENVDLCLEFHWRAGDFLVPTHRAEIARYILEKVKTYSVELGWVSD